jgi:alkanesulfonate monooxygenase SsuD/methylene tetrahydromethanopterin reductase-like flavin-dependent oxidoreductase (luciferase family)
MITNATGPTFGLWYDFRQRPPLGDYARLYAECFEEFEEAETLGYAGVWLSEHHFMDDGYLPSPLVVAARPSGTHRAHYDRYERAAPADAPSPAGG